MEKPKAGALVVSETLYEILGVPQDADEETIKQAWRRLAQKLHPDRDGGDAEAFKKAKSAYEILSDPKRRYEYDQTGETEDRSRWNTANAAIRQMLLSMVDQADLDHDDMIVFMGRVTTKKIKEANERIAELRELKIRRTRAKKRCIHKKQSGPNILAEALQKDIDGIEQQIEGAIEAIEIGNLIRKILLDYEYKTDPKPEPESAWGKGDLYRSLMFDAIGKPPGGRP